MDILSPLLATATPRIAPSAHATGMTPIRVAIIDDCADVRFLLATIIELDGRFEVVAEAGDVASALVSVAATEPDLVLIDLNLRGGDGSSAIRTLRQRGATPCVVVVSGSTTSDDRAVALDAGANAIQSKGSMTSTMVDELAVLVALHVANERPSARPRFTLDGSQPVAN